MRLLPVTVEEQPASVEQQETLPTAPAGTINIEFPGRALVSVEGSPDPAVVRAVIEIWNDPRWPAGLLIPAIWLNRWSRRCAVM